MAKDRASARTNGASGRGYERVPPHSLEAEVSVLGAALLSRTAASDTVELLVPDETFNGYGSGNGAAPGAGAVSAAATTPGGDA